jgi:hypothetical protein
MMLTAALGSVRIPRALSQFPWHATSQDTKQLSLDKHGSGRGTSAALLASVPSGMLALRILIEEQFLRRELKDYDAYTERVRYRLIPFLW